MGAEQEDPESFATSDGFVGEQGPRVVLPVYVAPATAEQSNTLRPMLSPLACWRLNEALFDFDSSFIRPGVRQSSPRFASLVRSNADSLASVFGHADPAGEDDYNKKLSGRRATAVYALLTRDVALWQQLHDTPLGNDAWGPRTVQVMLGEIPDPSATPPGPYYAGAITGGMNSATVAAAKKFQQDQGLAPDGVVGAQTRAKLYAAYMDAVCIDGSGQPFVMKPEQFVGKGKKPDGKGAYQGCSEFNPILLMSKADQQKYDSGLKPKSERDARNAPNRRAMVFLFRGFPEAAQDAWPCPTAKEGASGCKTMFWPDGDDRRSPGPAQREYRTDQRTMACSWYDRFARLSPCEGKVYTRISVTLRDRFARLLEGAPYRMTSGDRSRTGRAGDGNAVLTVPGVPDRCTVEWNLPDDDDIAPAGTPPAPNAPQPTYRVDLYVNYHAGTDDEQARKRLHNIGYPDSYAMDVATRAFQRDHALPQTGVMDAATREALIEAHGTLAEPTQTPDPSEVPSGG